MMMKTVPFQVLLLFLLQLQPAQAFIFSPCGSPCIFGIFGSYMRRQDDGIGGECEQTCALIPLFYNMFQWDCGKCNSGTNGEGTEPVPGPAPVAVPVPGPAPVAEPVPGPAPVVVPGPGPAPVAVPPPEIPSDVPLPPGPYIPADYSERIVLPQLATPSNLDSLSRTNCPHLADDLLDWHDASTWPGGATPASGADVTLPANTKVVVRQSVQPVLGLVTIPAG